MEWHNLRLLLVTCPPEPNLDAIAAAPFDAIVLQCAGPDAPVASVAAARPDRPLIVLADADSETSSRLVSAGADDVLPLKAPVTAIMRAVQNAVARKQREDGPWAVPPAAGSAPVVQPHIEAIVGLAGGVAQEFNNLLMVIEGNAERLLAALPEDDPRRARVAAITAASRRAVVLTQKLLAVGRRQPLTPTPLDLNAIITDSTPLLRRRLGRNVALITTLDPDLPQVRADRAQVVEVLASVARIAAEAMPGGGTFTVTTDTVVADADMRRAHPWLTPGRFVRLRLVDSGAGIDAQFLPHVFEPFFVRDAARGDGLDLSSVYGVIKQSSGFIWIDSEPGQGTSITILLPPLGVDSHTPSPSAPSAPRVLVVEDEEDVRALLIDVLHSHGLHPIAAGSAEEALAVSAQHEFDLLLTDVGLPGATGPELARDLRRRRPQLPVLFISGQSGDTVDADGDVPSPRAFLQKPFSSRALVATLQELLNWQKRS
jgi:signal transduction histidine kinase